LPGLAPRVLNYCQVAKISAKKLKMGREKLSWPEEFVAKFRQNFAKSGRKGAAKYFLKKFNI
jgi:hypothetical protein